MIYDLKVLSCDRCPSLLELQLWLCLQWLHFWSHGWRFEWLLSMAHGLEVSFSLYVGYLTPFLSCQWLLMIRRCKYCWTPFTSSALVRDVIISLRIKVRVASCPLPPPAALLFLVLGVFSFLSWLSGISFAQVLPNFAWSYAKRDWGGNSFSLFYFIYVEPTTKSLIRLFVDYRDSGWMAWLLVFSG